MSGRSLSGLSSWPIVACYLLINVLLADAAAAYSQQPKLFLLPELVSSCQTNETVKSHYEKHVQGGCGVPTRDGFPSTFPSEVVDKGVEVLGGPRTRDFLDKLRRGEAVTVLAIGGSSTFGDGGCWNYAGCKIKRHSDIYSLFSDPTYCRHQCPQEDQGGGSASWSVANREKPLPMRTGSFNAVWEPGRPALYQQYLTRFMHYLNTTFPNPGHVLRNHGRSGATGGEFLTCPSEWMLLEADLVIMEHAINYWDANDIEKLLGYVMRMPKTPAVLLFNLHNWKKPGKPSWKWPKTAEEIQSKYASPAAHKIKDEAAALATKWGLSSLSLYSFMAPVLTETFPPPAPFWPFEMNLDKMGVHCNTRYAKMRPYSFYMADLLIQWLRHMVAAPEELAFRPSRETAPPSGPAVSTCFTWGSKLGTTPAIVSNWNPHDDATIPKQYLVNPRVTTKWFEFYAPLDGPTHVRKRKKPGFYSVVPGATVDLRLSRDANDSGSTISGLSILYLASYAHVGVVKFECLKGCVCAELVLDTLISDKYTGQLSLEHKVSSFDDAEGCVVRVTNVGRPDGMPGNKLKLIGLSLLTGT